VIRFYQIFINLIINLTPNLGVDFHLVLV